MLLQVYLVELLQSINPSSGFHSTTFLDLALPHTSECAHFFVAFENSNNFNNAPPPLTNPELPDDADNISVWYDILLAGRGELATLFTQ